MLVHRKSVPFVSLVNDFTSNTLRLYETKELDQRPLDIAPPNISLQIESFHLLKDALLHQRILKPEEVIVLSREIQTMIAAGVPLDLGMHQASGGFDVHLEQISLNIASRLEQGATISEACRDESGIPSIFRAVLVAGLSCGESEAVLQDVTDLSQIQASLRQSLKLGFIYPLLILFISLALLGVVVTGLVPRIAGLYRQLHLDLPNWMSLLVSLNLDFLAVLGSVGLGFAGTMYLLSRAGNAPSLRGFKWIPGVAGLVSDFSLAHFSQLLSLLVNYGIPLPEALRLTGETVPKGTFQAQTFSLADDIEHGEDLELSLAKQSSFPQFLRWVLLAGHRESDLGNTLNQAAQFYFERARSRSIWIGQIVPVIAVVVLGGGVTLLYALAVFKPMIDVWIKLAEN